MATVQFDHRLLAASLAVAVPWLCWKLSVPANTPPRALAGARGLLAMLIAQIAFGIATLLLVVPLPLAALHQAGALLVFAFALNVAHALR
jgi:cytochrome c oxidase assembly protein subunit 15